MKQFINVTAISKDFFGDIEYEYNIIIGINQISAIYENEIVLGESKYVKLTPESMKNLKEYIECENCTGKAESEDK